MAQFYWCFAVLYVSLVFSPPAVFASSTLRCILSGVVNDSTPTNSTVIIRIVVSPPLNGAEGDRQATVEYCADENPADNRCADDEKWMNATIPECADTCSEPSGNGKIMIHFIYTA